MTPIIEFLATTPLPGYPLTGADKLKVTYVPSLDELNLTGSNTVKVDINDNVNNPMDQVVKSFQIK